MQAKSSMVMTVGGIAGRPLPLLPFVQVGGVWNGPPEQSPRRRSISSFQPIYGCGWSMSHAARFRSNRCRFDSFAFRMLYYMRSPTPYQANRNHVSEVSVWTGRQNLPLLVGKWRQFTPFGRQFRLANTPTLDTLPSQIWLIFQRISLLMASIGLEPILLLGNGF
jgi:hypothetical protein